jgi:hypothetical protein
MDDEMNKRKSVLMHKLVCLSHLMLENLDELNPTTEKMKKAKSDLIALFEELNNELASSDTIQKTTYFNDMSKKIDTIIRKDFDSSM